MRFRRGQSTPDNEQFVNAPVYGADPVGSSMVHGLDAANAYPVNRPQVPAWKPQGDRERKSSWLFPPYFGTALQGLPQVQNFTGAAVVSRVIWQRTHLQQLGVAQPQVMTESEAIASSALGLRLGTPGDAGASSLKRLPSRIG